MRELHAWHGDRRHGPDAAVDAPAAPAHDAPRLTVLRDPEVRKAESLKYQKKVEAADARYAAEQLKHHESKPEHAPPEATGMPASKIAERTEPPGNQARKQRRPERPRFPSNEITQFAAGIGVMLSSVADAFNVMPGKWDAVAASLLGAVVTGVAWGNKRWKDRHGDRP